MVLLSKVSEHVQVQSFFVQLKERILSPSEPLLFFCYFSPLEEFMLEIQVTKGSRDIVSAT